jgi:uncharacterized lipoprotein YajG
MAMGLTACLISNQPLPVSLTYRPDSTVQSVTGAASTRVDVTVKDLRQDKSTLGDANTIAMSFPIITNDDLAQVLKSAVESELANRGFDLGAGGALAAIDLEGVAVDDHKTFNVDNINDVRAIVIIGAQVKPDNGKVLYSKVISGKIAFESSRNETFSSASERALDYALDEAVRNLMNDPEFIKALLATRNTVKPATSAIHPAPQQPTPK